MPTKRKDRNEEWLARVTVNGRQVASQTFPPGRKKGPEWTAARAWEVKTKQDIEELMAKGHTLLAALEVLGIKPSQQILAENQQEKTQIPTGLKRLWAWGDGYLDHAQRTMGATTYKEKQLHLKAFFAFCKLEGIQSLEAITKPKANQFLVSIYKAKEKEAEERLAARLDENADPEKPKKGGKIGNPASVANKYRKNILAAWNWGTDTVENFPQGKSPFAMVKEFPVDATDRYVPPEDDVIKVLELAEGQDLVMLLVFYYTGARAGEVFKLSWQRDIRLEEGAIRLEDYKTRDGKKRIRWKDMHPELVKALAWWRDARPCAVDNVFMRTHCHSAMGKPFRHRSKFCERLCKRAGVKPFVFYSIRHVSAHISFREGGMSAAKEQLGHYHATTTDKYLRKVGLFTDQGAIQDALSRSEIGRAALSLLEKALSPDVHSPVRSDGDGESGIGQLEQAVSGLLEKAMPRKLVSSEAFCNQNHVTNMVQ